MQKIIESLRHDADHKEYMIGTTAPSTYLLLNSQEDWDDQERKEILELRKAAGLLEGLSIIFENTK